MKVSKYLVVSSFTLLNTLFLKGDYVYLSIDYVPNGENISVRQFFSFGRQYLGTFKFDDILSNNIEYIKD